MISQNQRHKCPYFLLPQHNAATQAEWAPSCLAMSKCIQSSKICIKKTSNFQDCLTCLCKSASAQANTDLHLDTGEMYLGNMMSVCHCLNNFSWVNPGGTYNWGLKKRNQYWKPPCILVQSTLLILSPLQHCFFFGTSIFVQPVFGFGHVDWLNLDGWPAHVYIS